MGPAAAAEPAHVADRPAGSELRGACTLNIVPAVAVEVRDASTDDFIAGLVQGVVADGAFEDSLRVVATLGTDPALPTTLGGADERAGTYAVRLEAQATRHGTRPTYE